MGLSWGPIIWGLIGLMVGGILGFAIKYLFNKGRKIRTSTLKDISTEVVIIVNCEKTQAAMVETVLWNHFALGVAKFDRVN